MCGIAGIIASDPAKVHPGIIKKMTDEIAHRGPDGEGIWISRSGLAGLGHRRLSIIDPGPAAAQPMQRLDRYTIIHNGELYNYIEIRHSLLQKGYSFGSRSDTEVILAAFDYYGPQCLQHFDGMFAFAIWDELEKKLFLARDRMGEKPLFFYQDDDRFLFASEMKSLWVAGVPREVNKKLLFNFLTIGYTQNPGDSAETFYSGILKLPARSFLLYDAITGQAEQEVYWDIALGNPGDIGEEEAIRQFRELLYGSVSRRLRSDAPIGAGISGGLDSSSIVAAVLQEGDSALRTFSAVFPGFEKDETPFIRLVTDWWPVRNDFVTPTVDGLIDEWEKLAKHQEEPFSSTSIYAQFKVYELGGRAGMKVMLDGQGADELLAGYHKYYPWYWQELYRKDPKACRRELQAARNLGISRDWSWKNKVAAMLPGYSAILATRQRIHHQQRNEDLSKRFLEEAGVSYYQLPHFESLDGGLYYNMFTNGLEELLRYADRNSMAHGVEVRLPFLNHKLIEFVFSLPPHFKIRDGWTKWLLRKAMEPALPSGITWRKDKTGYEPPQREWMQHPVLVDYIHEAKKTLISESILRPEVTAKKNRPLDAHAADNHDWRQLVSAACLFGKY
ncbi:MAG: asparagine synthase (glutamine-hydrolyzing) [Puia sp.]|nr:asparagine synthase (glutamine-hydrolyzing) [Puia sp.]